MKDEGEMISKTPGGRRKLLDMYGDSLKFVNKLLTAKFGAASRKVPAHMPHMIDKRVLTDLHNTYVSEMFQDLH
jgi:UDP-N-acetylglucosamine-lysosomal-enzyme